MQLVVRLNENEYDRDEFLRLGLQHLDLPFSDCTEPPPALVDAFLRAARAEAVPGLETTHIMQSRVKKRLKTVNKNQDGTAHWSALVTFLFIRDYL